MSNLSLIQEFNSLVQTAITATNEKIDTLLEMNKLLSSFDESWEYANIETHMSGDVAAEVIYQAGDELGCDYYLHSLHPKFTLAINQEESALEELRTFITGLNLSIAEDINTTPLSVLGIMAGKIITDVIGTA